LFFNFSELELKPQGKLTVTVVKANDLKNMEMIGKSDPYAVVYIRPMFKVKTQVVDNNLNPVWNQTFDLIAEDKETQSLILEVLNLSYPPSFCSCYSILPFSEQCLRRFLCTSYSIFCFVDIIDSLA
jgi:hypothetical protein